MDALKVDRNVIECGNEGIYCSNCSSVVSYNESDAETGEKDYIEFIVDSCFRKVTTINAVVELYKLSCRSMELELDSKLPLCYQCSGILSNLYKLYERFNSLRNVDSVISQLIASTDMEDSQSTALENMDHENTNNHPVFNGITRNDKSGSCFLGDKNEEAGSQREKGICEKREDEMLAISTDSIIEIPLPNGMLVLEGEDYDPESQVEISVEEAIGNSSEESGSFIGEDRPVDIQESSSIQSEGDIWVKPMDANGTETQMEFPRSTTAIAVPIGENIFQIYRVAPVLPKKPPFACIQCGKVKKSLRSLRNHVHNVHDTHKFVKCPHCLKAFRKPCLLKRHLVVHDEDRISRGQKFRKAKSLFSCTWPDCGRSFPYKASLRRHEARHRPERPFVCPGCNKGFKLIGDLRNHMEFHKEERPYICDKCGKSYKVASNLNTHIVNVHTEKGRLKYNEYMRMKTKEKRLSKLAKDSESTKVDKNICNDLRSEQMSVHEDFPDIFVASEAEIGTEEITVEFS